MIIGANFPTEDFEQLMEVFENEDYEELEQHVEDGIDNIIHDFSNMHITERKNIKWQRSPFSPPQLKLRDIKVKNTIEIEPPIAYFSKYFVESDFDKMVHYTNLYALQNCQVWKQTDKWEIKTFIGIHIYMDTLKLPRIRLYWDHFVKFSTVTDNMSRIRFFLLRTNFHVIDNLTIPKENKDKFIKVRPVFNCVKRRCNDLIIERRLNIYEQMIPFKGHLSVKQYIKGKSNPWGIKVLLCGESGKIYDFILYQESNTEIEPNLLKCFGLGGSVVLTLTKNLEPNKHFLHFDNYFPGYNLFEVLNQKQIYAVGTIQENRFAKPPLLADKIISKIGQGTSDEITNKKKTLTLVKWYDNKSVNLASNFISKGVPDYVDRWSKKEKKYISVERPEIVRLYNASMGGVDKIDQLISYYRIFMKSKKWTLRMIFHSIHMAISNSWLEYIEDCKLLSIPPKKRMDLLHFRLRLAHNLVYLDKFEIKKRSRGRPSEGSSSFKDSPALKKKNLTLENNNLFWKTDLII